MQAESPPPVWEIRAALHIQQLPSEASAPDCAGKSKGKKKSKKKAADLDYVFAALDQNGTPDNGDVDSGIPQPDSMTNGAHPDVEADELAAFGKKKKKSSKQKGQSGYMPVTTLDYSLFASAVSSPALSAQKPHQVTTVCMLRPSFHNTA